MYGLARSDVICASDTERNVVMVGRGNVAVDIKRYQILGVFCELQISVLIAVSMLSNDSAGF